MFSRLLGPFARRTVNKDNIDNECPPPAGSRAVEGDRKIGEDHGSDERERGQPSLRLGPRQPRSWKTTRRLVRDSHYHFFLPFSSAKVNVSATGKGSEMPVDSMTK